MTKVITVKIDPVMQAEVDKLVPGTYVNRTELVLKAIRKLLIEDHNVKF